MELDAHNPMHRGHFAMYLLVPVGRIEEALEQLRIGERADPLSYEIHFDAAYVLLAAGRYHQAARHCGKLCMHGHCMRAQRSAPSSGTL